MTILIFQSANLGQGQDLSIFNLLAQHHSCQKEWKKSIMRMQILQASAQNSESTMEDPSQRRQSTMFAGRSIFQRLANSSFGAFHRAMQTLPDIPMEDFFMPQVIVIGEESSGKSSLLEALTKCPVFPRDQRFCTKMPVRMQLTPCQEGDSNVRVTFEGEERRGSTRDDILGFVTSIMSRLPRDTIVKNELIIEIHEPNIPTFSFVDLPGIRAFPQAMQQATRELVADYLRRPKTLVLCVVPATTQRLTAAEAIGMVMAHDKAAQTVVALTMCDKVTPGNVPDLILDRLSGQTDELADTGLGACVATINRTHDDGWTIQEADAMETD